MDVNKWKSIAVDIESYTIIRAMGENGLRNPGNMIKKMVNLLLVTQGKSILAWQIILIKPAENTRSAIRLLYCFNVIGLS